MISTPNHCTSVGVFYFAFGHARCHYAVARRYHFFQYTAAAWLSACTFATLALWVARLCWQDERVHLFSFAGGTGNTGYFALPLAITLFDDAQVAIAVFIILGVSLYEFTFGYWVTASSQFQARDCFKKVLRLPILYAAILGIVLKGWVSSCLCTYWILHLFQGAYSVLGMMMMG